MRPLDTRAPGLGDGVSLAVVRPLDACVLLALVIGFRPRGRVGSVFARSRTQKSRVACSVSRVPRFGDRELPAMARLQEFASSTTRRWCRRPGRAGDWGASSRADRVSFAVVGAEKSRAVLQAAEIRMRPAPGIGCHPAMTIVLSTPRVGELPAALAALRGWQRDGAPWQLHPGDVGWFWRAGAENAAAALRIWRWAGDVVAVGLLDGSELLRLTLAPDVRRDEVLARRLFEDVTTPSRGVLPTGRVAVEAPADALLRDLLADAGWPLDEPWSPFRCDLTDPVADPGVRVEIVGPAQVSARTAVHRAAFNSPRFTADAWHTMSTGPGYADARCVLAYDADGNPVAAATVWSAGAGRPGLIEPLGVDPAHRHHGYGRAITLAAQAALRDLGSSSALVNTPSANVGAVATYRAANFEPLPPIHDRYRAA
ncbi:GNAT family N-acetyltransferase [Amycolatopsis rhabdoformis]|uniref:GNAT family N-acetyltransferase n=1 Tax=Amycolatopsis rhabdoformis TaxID=1448059 RepID=A0ABZ1I336_9PSEU|nr:GNAT family N-acetyltransferase [Amycolatopsis rhabdoformis]WSE28814.1 GNAT family N-acetyltransferase [Amycolatopsis rhabdoformis]